MRTNDIFKRLDKKSDVPLSLFPCSSMHRTSMRIGRAVPMYSINMFQGNKIELSASQLTRFSTLDKPVMNNYEINLGFFFVPWTAHDEMGTSAWFRKTILGNSSYSSNYASVLKDYKLNANEFFDPAFDNALRHHPIMVKLKHLGNIKLVGSLYDHLGYYIGTGTDVSNYAKFYSHAYNAANGATGGTNTLIADLVGGKNPYFVPSSNAWAPSKCGVISNTTTPSTLTNTDRVCLPLDMWVYVHYWFDTVNQFRCDNMSFDAFKTFYTTYIAPIIPNTTEQKLIGAIHTTLGIASTPAAPVGDWDDYFGTLKPAAVLDAYNEYLNSIALFDSEGDFKCNCLDWLNYMRIYADWFLNDHFTRRDDFLDMIGEAYYRACFKLSGSNDFDVTKLFTAGTAANPNTMCSLKLNQSPELQFFAKYISNGECLPVLWELSRYTAQRCEVDMTGIAGLTDTASTLSPGDTAVGTTIREHFFNRAVQKFKDLVSRVGYDFRNNTREIYGSGVSDAILNRSQLIAIKKFNVNVGDVQQTSESSSKGTLGDFGGFAYSKNGTDRVSWKAEQNGTFMVLAWIRPRNVAYATGIDREKFKDDYLDYLIPQFGGVGYQDVYANEIHASASNSITASLGHEEIYSEYMSKPNYCTGNMRTYNKNWHSDRFFTSNPVIAKGSSPKFLYITDDDDVDRIFSNSIDDPVLCTCYFDGNITRQLPSRIKTDF